MKKWVGILLIIFVFLSLFLNVVYSNSTPPCLNADEAAFGYNAYSIIKTGKDEYGQLLPLRFKSFGDYKMPLYSYLSIPFIALFGLNDFGVRALNLFASAFFPIVVYFLSKELFNDKRISLIAAFLTSISLGLHIVGRQAHEAYITALFITLSSLFFLKSLKNPNKKNKFFFLLFILFSLFGYQSSRLFALLFLTILFFNSFKNHRWDIFFILSFCSVILFFSITDFVYQPTRIKNLFFLNNIGFNLKIDELRAEGGNRLLYNKLTEGVKEAVFKYLQHLSPQFLVTNGDGNYRFGYPELSLVTITEFFLIFLGLYFLFKNKEKWRFFILSLLFASPLSSSLSWAEPSITRSLFFLIPIIVTIAYGAFHLLNTIPPRYFPIVSGVLILSFVFFSYSNWDFYFFHYSKKAQVIRSWQCGNKEMADYVKNNYHRFDRFYITRKNGQPYIFLLFYLHYPPSSYQKEAFLSAPDEFGFGQVEKFDKFIFSFQIPQKEKRVALIGYADDFPNPPNNIFEPSRIKKIKVGEQEIFWIYEIL